MRRYNKVNGYWMRGGLALMLVALVVTVAGCELLGLQSGGRNSDFIAASQDDPFELEFGQTAVLEELGLAIRFVDVPEDSRCPIGHACVWAGQVRAAFELTQPGSRQPIEIVGFVGGSSDGPKTSVEIGDVHITLLALAPYPVHDPSPRRPVPPVVATLRITTGA